MGRYENGKYYRSKNDAELQWLEDGVGLVGKTFCGVVLLFILGAVQISIGLFTLLTGKNTD